jgi:hypothetical protein
MITAKQILEEYLDRIQTRRGSAEVFINPSKKEMIKDIGKEIRFLGYAKTKTFYTWNAHNAFHEDMMNALHVHPHRMEIIHDGDEIGVPVDLYVGCATRHGNNYEVDDSHPIELLTDKLEWEDDPDRLPMLVEASQMLFNEDWSWMKRYVDMDEYMISFEWALDGAKKRLERK